MAPDRRGARLAAAALAVAPVPLVGALGALTLAPIAKERSEGPRAEGSGRRLAVVAQAVAGLNLALCLAWFALSGFPRLRDSTFVATFFSGEQIVDAMPKVARAFVLNIKLMAVSEALVLVFALLVAMSRSATTPALRPLRWLAAAYTDVFRALPALLVVYLIGFGVPLAGIPFLSSLSLFWLACLALTLVYGAYVAEVYRAGIDAVHWSQAAAARSLGLSQLATLRFVVLPQAIRRVIPPLLNDFIGLQKDTVFVSTIGLIETFRRAQLVAGQTFNPTAITCVGFLYLAITLPMTRLTDHLLRREARRTRAR